MNANSSRINMSNAATIDAGTFKIIFIVLLAAAIVLSIGFLLYKYFYLPSAIKIPTTANMIAILEKRKRELKALYEGIDRKKGLAPLAANQNFLVNYHSLFQSCAGYIGPYYNGVIDSASAIPLSMANGARGFILNVEDIDGRPMAIVRDAGGKRLSLNDVHVGEIIDAIVASAFKESIEGRANTMRDDPCVIYFKFAKKPSAACAESLANALNRHRSVLLSVNEKGDFTHHRNEDKLFLLTPADVARKIIVVCNLDTNEFKGKGTMKPGLDYYINGRVWKYNELSKDASRVRAIYEASHDFLKSLNEDGIDTLKKDARLKYFIVVNNDLRNGGEVEKAREYGLQGLGGFSFDSEELRSAFKEGGMAKVKELRYIVPEPIKIAPAPKEMNSNGGVIVAPKM